MRSLNCVNQFESVVLRQRDDIEEFLVNRLTLAASVEPLHPRVLPIRIEFLAGDDHFARLQCEQRAVLAETNLKNGTNRHKVNGNVSGKCARSTHIQPRMESWCSLRDQNGSGRDKGAILTLPASMFRSRMLWIVPRTASRLLRLTTNLFCENCKRINDLVKMHLSFSNLPSIMDSVRSNVRPNEDTIFGKKFILFSNPPRALCQFDFRFSVFEVMSWWQLTHSSMFSFDKPNSYCEPFECRCGGSSSAAGERQLD